MCDLQEELLAWLKTQGGELQVQGPRIAFTKVLGERRTWWARRRVLLRASFHVREDARELVVQLRLVEQSFGLPGLSGLWSTKESLRLGRTRSGHIQETMRFFSQRYRFTFDYTGFQKTLAELAERFGYSLHWEM